MLKSYYYLITAFCCAVAGCSYQSFATAMSQAQRGATLVHGTTYTITKADDATNTEARATLWAQQFGLETDRCPRDAGQSAICMRTRNGAEAVTIYRSQVDSQANVTVKVDGYGSSTGVNPNALAYYLHYGILPENPKN